LPRIYPTFGAVLARLPRVPDLLTTANLACGLASILLASQGQLTLACGLVFLAALFDVLDGLAARALGQGGTEFGKQLDSLADMVSFGVAPGMLVFGLSSMMTLSNWSGWTIYPPLSAIQSPNPGGEWSGDQFTALLAAAVIAICSAWRLAIFNLDARQSSGFLGYQRRRMPCSGHRWFFSYGLLLWHSPRNDIERRPV
jgi:CDP-diacylglycerol--serine O-phosphatidyltransferase